MNLIDETNDSDQGDASAAGLSHKANELFKGFLAKNPKVFARSSFGKYDDFRRWLAAELDLADWEHDTYATGASTTAHNFGSRWSQSNEVSGRHVPLGIGFIQVNEADPESQQDAIDAMVKSVANTSKKFVDGTRPTSYEAILVFTRLNDAEEIVARGVVCRKGSELGTRLNVLFPEALLIPVERIGGTPAGSTVSATVAAATSKSIQPPTPIPLDEVLPKSLHTDLANANFHCDSGLIWRTIAALLAKRFLILAGQTGSGKTQLAKALARWLATDLAQYEVVAVEADWKSSQKVLGSPDGIDPSNYITTKALNFILKASANPKLPFFLIFDEMNLSHVERYFAQFLSCIETGEDLYLHGSDQPKGGIPGSIPLPSNLFVIGTVNVDETTYMFSPKVLDRANVIEFAISRDDLARFADNPRPIDFEEIDGKGASYGEAFVQAAASDIDNLDDSEIARLSAEITLIFELFDEEGFAFAYRTVKEISRFICFYKELSETDWSFDDAVDAQILQRLMPKLQGDKKRLKGLLLRLGTICSLPHTWTDKLQNKQELFDAAQKSASSLSDDIPPDWMKSISAVSATAPFKLSLRKTIRMLKQLRREGFTSFIEA